MILLELGASPDAADIWGSSPLHLAAQRGEVRCAERLLDGGAAGTAHDNKVYIYTMTTRPCNSPFCRMYMTTRPGSFELEMLGWCFTFWDWRCVFGAEG